MSCARVHHGAVRLEVSQPQAIFSFVGCAKAVLKYLQAVGRVNFDRLLNEDALTVRPARHTIDRA